MPFTPDTVVKKKTGAAKKKNFKKIKSVNAKALEKLMDTRGIEMKGLKDILKKSKKGFKDFLRSFGWSDHEIEDVMRTGSAGESPEKKRVEREYRLGGQRERGKSTFTKNIVIKEYIPVETVKKDAKEKTQSNFFSKQTNCVRLEPEEESNAKCVLPFYKEPVEANSKRHIVSAFQTRLGQNEPLEQLERDFPKKRRSEHLLRTGSSKNGCAEDKCRETSTGRVRSSSCE